MKSFKEKVKDFMLENGVDTSKFQLRFYKRHKMLYIYRVNAKTSLIESKICRNIVTIIDEGYLRNRNLQRELLYQLRGF